MPKNITFVHWMEVKKKDQILEGVFTPDLRPNCQQRQYTRKDCFQKAYFLHCALLSTKDCQVKKVRRSRSKESKENLVKFGVALIQNGSIKCAHN